MATIIDTLLLLAGLALMVTGAYALCGAYALLTGGAVLVCLAIFPATKTNLKNKQGGA